MYNLLQNKGTSFIKINKDCNIAEGRPLFSKGLKFNPTIERVVTEESIDINVTITHVKLFSIDKSLTLAIEVFLNNGSEWKSIASQKHIFNSIYGDSEEITIPYNIIEFINTKNRKNEVLNFKIVVECEESLYESWNFSQLNCLVRKIKNDHKKYLEQKPTCDFVENLWYTRTCWDFLFKIDDKEFKVHRNILAVQSKVFMKIFEKNEGSSYSQVLTNTSVINDLSAAAFYDFLAYLYVQQVPTFNEHTIDLYKAAAKYEIKDLMIACELLIMDNVTCANAIEILYFANKYNKELIKLLAMQKVSKYFPNEKLPPQIRNHPEMLKDLIQSKRKLKSDLKTAHNNYKNFLIRAKLKHENELSTAQGIYDRKFRGVTYQFIAK